MGEPAHNEFVSTQQLHAVDAEIHALFFRTSGNNQWPGNQWSDISRPAGLNR